MHVRLVAAALFAVVVDVLDGAVPVSWRCLFISLRQATTHARVRLGCAKPSRLGGDSSASSRADTVQPTCPLDCMPCLWWCIPAGLGFIERQMQSAVLGAACSPPNRGEGASKP